MLDLNLDLKGLLTVGLVTVSTFTSSMLAAEPLSKVPSAVLRPFVPPIVKPIDIAPSLPVVKEVHLVQPILSKTPVTDTLKLEHSKTELKTELAKAEINPKLESHHPVKADAPKATVEASPISDELSAIVEGLLGVKYKFGANNPKVALDCSALILRIMEARGKKDLPRTAHMLAASSKPVERHNLKAGDLLFFNTRGWDSSHVGMYMGDGRFVHASQQKGKVTFSSLSAAYFAKRFTGARRVIH